MLTLACMVLAAQAASPTGSTAWWNNAWTARNELLIDVAWLETPLHDFPLRLVIPGDRLALDRAKADASDIRVVSEKGEVLDTLLSNWSDSGAELVVRIPELAPNTVYRLFVYYGNADAPRVQANPFSAGYVAVANFRNGPNNILTGKPLGKTQGAKVDAQGAHFAGELSYLEIAPDIVKSLSRCVSIATRMRPAALNGMQTLAAGAGAGGANWFNFGMRLPDTLHTNTALHGQAGTELNSPGLSPTQWHAVSAQYNGDDRSRTTCLDGRQLLSDHSLGGPLQIDEFRIGRGVKHFTSWQFHGDITEFRLSNVPRSQDWIRLETLSLSDHLTYLAAGSAHILGQPSPGPLSIIAPELLGPAQGFESHSRGAVALKWTACAGATGYRVEFYDSPNATSPRFTKEVGRITTAEIERTQFSNSQDRYWTVVALSAGGETPATERRAIRAYDWNAEPTPVAPKDAVAPLLHTAVGADYDLSGYLRGRIDRLVQEYYVSTPATSPAMLQILRDRDKRPVRDPLMPWAGEFAGKYLTGAVLHWRLTRDETLKTTIDAFARDLIATQAPNGYLGPFPAETRLTGRNWDIWGHYHCMLGLMFYYEDTGYEPALDACRRAADLLFETFGPGGPLLTNDDGAGSMNMAVCHSLVLLYKKTGVQRYLDLAKYIVHEAWNSPGAGRWLESALAGKPVVEFPQHRWECIHSWQALAELYWLTGDDQYRRALMVIWESGLRGDRHNTGGVTAGEGFQGTPYHTAAIETCCTVAWVAMALDVLRMTGDSRIADELEWSTLNSALGAIPYGGRVCAYNVPMDGTRLFGVELPWQSPKAGPDLNCCAVNAGRPLGMIAQWGLMSGNDNSLNLNYYGPGKMHADVAGQTVELLQETNYPVENTVRLTVKPRHAANFTLNLRIPSWSQQTVVKMNGQETPAVAGTYLPISRKWKKGDVVELTFDFSLRFWAGEQEFANKVSVYRGPLLLAYDARYTDLNPDQVPALDWKSTTLQLQDWQGPIAPWLLGTLRSANGAEFPVCDFSSAGQTGNHYLSWLPSRDCPPSAFHLLSSQKTPDGVQLSWEKRAGAESWVVRTAAKRDFSDATTITVNEPKVTVPSPAGPMYWTVDALNAHGATAAGNGPMEFGPAKE